MPIALTNTIQSERRELYVDRSDPILSRCKHESVIPRKRVVSETRIGSIGTIQNSREQVKVWLNENDR